MSNRARIFLSKAEDLLPRLPADSFDSVVCDPPYGLSELKPALVTKALNAWLGGDRWHVPDGRGFMGREWDKFVPPPGIWDECFRVLKPGGHLLAFSAPRTQDLMGLSIRLAGFEIRDSLHWLMGSGFPKGLDVSKAIDKAAGAEREVVGIHHRHGGGSEVSGSMASPLGTASELPLTVPATEAAVRWEGWGTALKPAHEPVILARKPLSEGTVAANVLRWGTGAINVDGCKVGFASDTDLAKTRSQNQHATTQGSKTARLGANGCYGDADNIRPDYDGSAGRWPPNLLLTHSADCQPAGTRRVKPSNGSGRASGNSATPGMFMDKHAGIGGGFVDADGMETVQAYTCAPGCPVAGLDAQSGTLKSGAWNGVVNQGKCFDVGKPRPGERVREDRHADTGGASRFFPQFTWSPEYDLPFMYCAKAPKRERPRIVTDDGRVIQHPTVKPLALMRWLVRLVTPPGGTVGDFFTGTGPVVQAALEEGMRCVACDQDPDSVALSRVRLAPYAGVKFTVPEPAEQPDAEAECG